MIYSDVVRAGLILPKKPKYTMRDVHTVMVNSLFGPVQTKTLDKGIAVFVVKCSAVFHETEYADSLATWSPEKDFLKSI